MQLGDKMASQANHGMKATGEPKTLQASVIFPPLLYTTLERIAKEKKVFVARVMREAAEKYVDEQWTLFAGKSRGG